MSFSRYVYYCAMAGGWGAFFGWGLIELTGRGESADLVGIGVLGAMLGSLICGALSAFNTLLNGSASQLPKKVGFALVSGAVGGAVATVVAQVLFAFGAPRSFSWMFMGIGVGLVEGVFEQSPTKLRNGIIGGAAGGLLGGLLFDPIYYMVGSDVPSRAIGFVIVGLFIGALIGLVQVILKQAWLVVSDGYRPGRQLIMSTPVTILGRGDHLPLPFLGLGNADLDLEHVRIVRQPNGGYLLEDNNSRLGTHLNGQRITGPTSLKDQDLIKFGSNYVRFNEKRTADASGTGPAVGHAVGGGAAPVPPPPPNASVKPRVSPPPTAGANPGAPYSAPATAVAPPPPAPVRKSEPPVVSRTQPPAPSVPVPPPPVVAAGRTEMPSSSAGGVKPPPPPPAGGSRPMMPSGGAKLPPPPPVRATIPPPPPRPPAVPPPK